MRWYAAIKVCSLLFYFSVRVGQVQLVCQPVLQLMPFTDPSCNGDITAPVLAGEMGGVVWWLPNARTAIWKTPVKLLIFSNASELVEEKLGPYGDVNKAGVAVLGESLVLVLSSGLNFTAALVLAVKCQQTKDSLSEPVVLRSTALKLMSSHAVGWVAGGVRGWLPCKGSW